MRVMVIIKATEASEKGIMPSERLLTEMTDFNMELADAGIMKAGEGLHPSSKGVRIDFSGDARTVVDGPFPETKELIAGFWIWEVESMEEAVQWAKKIPNTDGEHGVVELRQVFDSADFGEALTPETREKEARIAEKIGSA